MILQLASARICETPATIPGWSNPNTEITIRSDDPSAELNWPRTSIDSRRRLLVVSRRNLFVDIGDQLLDGRIINRITQTVVNRSGDSVNQVFIGHWRVMGD
jgi:hypothetical protein